VTGQYKSELPFQSANFLPDGSSRELLHHGKQQLSVALIQIRRIAADLRKEAEFLVREFLGVELAAERVVGKKLGDGQIEGLGNL
jgi:hypothetical protein